METSVRDITERFAHYKEMLGTLQQHDDYCLCNVPNA